jgi:hypothetical protein
MSQNYTAPRPAYYVPRGGLRGIGYAGFPLRNPGYPSPLPPNLVPVAAPRANGNGMGAVSPTFNVPDLILWALAGWGAYSLIQKYAR